MALFFHDDANFQVRQTGFARYRQLLSFYGFHWLRVNLITTAGALPLAAGILVSVLYSSSLMLIPLSIIGGIIFGPFLAGLFDAIMRGLRDAPGNWFQNYKKSWRQNWRGSLLPGAITGFFTGIFTFMFYVMWSGETAPGAGTIIIFLVAVALFLMVSMLYWPQLVLFEQKNSIRLKNAVLFMIKHSWKVLGMTVLQMAYLAFYVLLAPLTLILVPFLGLWFMIFLTQYKLYAYTNADYRIEEQFIPIEGDPWAPDPMMERAYGPGKTEDDEEEE